MNIFIAMATLIDPIKNVLYGMLSSLFYDRIIGVWKKSTQQDWDTLIISIFEKIISQEKPYLAKFIQENGVVEIDRTALSKNLHQDLEKDINELTYSELANEENLDALIKAMVKRETLILGGHQLSKEEYTYKVRNLVYKVKDELKAVIFKDSDLYEKILLGETLLNKKVSRYNDENLDLKIDNISQGLERLTDELVSPLVDYSSWQTKQNLFFLKCLRSETESRVNFGELINVEDENINLIRRKTAWATLDEWFNDWKNSRKPFAVLGEEGDGKTWTVASWLSQKIKTVDGFPPILFLRSINVNVDDNEPKNLLYRAVVLHLPRLEQEQGKKQIERWIERSNKDTPLFFLVLDGINERRNSEWWRTLLDNLAGETWANRVAVLITCRQDYWNRHFQPLSYLKSVCYILPPYSDSELEEALAFQNLRRSDIQADLLSLIRKPRYFDLMVKYRKKIAKTGDVTVARLIYEDWKDRFERKRSIQLLDDDFQNFICVLAKNYQERSNFISEPEIVNALPRSIENKMEVFEELRTGGIIQSTRNKYKVNEKLLIYGFGLLLVDELEEASRDPEDVLFETVAGWLEPHSEMDIKAAICEFAALHALSLSDYPKPAKIALLQTWIYSQNPEQTTGHDFIAYLPLDPECYIELAEKVWSNTTENAWGQELLMQAFLRWRDSPSVSSHLHSAFEHWLGFVYIDGVLSLFGHSTEAIEQSKQEIADRLGRQPQAGQKLSFGTYTLTAIENDGLLRLGRVALAVISHLPRSNFLHAIATGCLSDAIMDMPSISKDELFSWLFRSSQEPLWEKVLDEFNQLIPINTPFAQKAAGWLLDFEGSQEAYQLKQTLPQNLTPIDPWMEEQNEDPCNSWFPWTELECEICLNRNDLSPEQIAKNLKILCINPDLLVPDNLGQRLADLTKKINIQNIRSNVNVKGDDLNLEQYEPALCAYAPNAIVDLARSITNNSEEREDLALHYLVFKLFEYSLIFSATEQESIYRTWTRLINKSSILNEKEKVTEAFLCRLILKNLTSEQQLSFLLQRPEDAEDLLACERSFLPINNWKLIHQYLTSDATTKTIERVLWFLLPNAKFIPQDIVQQKILQFLNHQNSFVRSLALKILFYLENQELIQDVIKELPSWKANEKENDDNTFEMHWGSLLLAKYASHLPYSELRDRIHPRYLGYAIQCRGMINEEIERYKDDIQSIWLKIGNEITIFDIPSLSLVSCIDDQEIPMLLPIFLSNSLFNQNIVYFNRNASWGGIVKGDSQNWGDIISQDSDEKRQYIFEQARSEIDKQHKAGNIWFAQPVYPYVLNQVIDQYPNLLDQWLSIAFADESKSDRYLQLGHSFYETLCTVLLKTAHEQGISLYWRLQEAAIKAVIKIDIRDENSQFRLIDYAFFMADPSEQMKCDWKKKLEACKTDRDLLEIAILAQYGNAGDWLWSIIDLGISTNPGVYKSRAIVLLAFINDEKAHERLNLLLENQPDTWIKHLIEVSRQLWQKNNWAIHWFSKFLNVSDDIQAWCSFRLFLRCVDSRFWFWRHQIKPETPESSDIEKRYKFLEDNIDTIKNIIKKNEEPLQQGLFGHKVLVGQISPWM